MSSNKRNKAKNSTFLAPDILSRSQNWMQKVSSIRLSNIRVGQQITNLLADKDSNEGSTKSSSVDFFHPSFCKLMKTKSGGSLVFVGGKNGLRIWLCSSATKNLMECSTELLHDGDGYCLDLCFSDQISESIPLGEESVVVYLLQSLPGVGGHAIRVITLTGVFSAASSQQPLVNCNSSNDRQYEGSACAISCTKNFLLVSQSQTGSVILLHRHSLHKAGEIPSLGPNRPVVVASSSRWVGIQTPQDSVAATQKISQNKSGIPPRPSTMPDMGEAARQVVTGLYSLSQASLQVVTPFIKGAVQGKHAGPVKQRDSISESKTVKKEIIGGGVLVLDTATVDNYEDNSRIGLSVDMTVRSHFVAHSADLGSMAFSPTGLKLASADCYGQVVLVHSLGMAGLLSRAHPVVSSQGQRNSLSQPQLLYKLVRGLSMSSFVDLGFSASENVAYAATANGTVHIFDLDQLSVVESSQGHSHCSSLGSHKSGGSSWNNGGFGSLEHVSLIATPPQSSSVGSNFGSGGPLPASTLLTMSADTVNDGAYHQYGIPSANVSQFLFLNRPDYRVLQGYSDVRVTLPLSEAYYQQQLQHATEESKRHQLDDDQLNDSTVDNSCTTVPNNAHEVNLYSHSLLYTVFEKGENSNGGLCAENHGNFELLVGTSEGLLSRFRVTLGAHQVVNGNGVVPSVLSTLMPYATNQSSKELNRWDLCAALGNCGSKQHSHGTAAQQNSRHGMNNEINVSAWLHAAGDVDEPLVLPVWLRPQVKLFSFGENECSQRHDIKFRDQHIDPNGVDRVDQACLNGNGSYHKEESDVVVAAPKKNKKKRPKQNQTTFRGSDDNDGAAEKCLSNGNFDSILMESLFFPERMPCSQLKINRPSTFVCHTSSAPNNGRPDTSVMLEEYIQTALGVGMDVNHNTSVTMIKHAKPREDISHWHMDDDWDLEDEPIVSQNSEESTVSKAT